MKEKSVSELKAMMDNHEAFQLIDVRETHETDVSVIPGSILIPMNEIPDHIEEIAGDKPVIIQCKSGGRSARIADYLEQAHGFQNIYNLTGGIMAWESEIKSK